MIGLDTNVLVRFLTRDHPGEFERARALLERGRAAGEAFFVADVVLAELVWVLERAYRRPRGEVATVLQGLAESVGVEFESPARVLRALAAYRAGKGGFSDYLLAARAWEAGCATVATFDEDLLREDGFVSP